MRKDPKCFFAAKARREPVVVLTCYDCPTARLEDTAGIDIMLVGDSVGTNLLGYASEREVTMEDMLHHVAAVNRGRQSAFLLADMPYASYDTPASALANARRFLAAGADGVKLEGGRVVRAQVEALRAERIEVCGHLGYTPQIKGPRPKVVGRTPAEARELIADAEALCAAGIFMLVLELVPEELACHLAARLPCIVIGIGAGRNLDGEVQVVRDVLGLTGRAFRHAKAFADGAAQTAAALAAYAGAVRARTFPEERNVTHLPPEVGAELGIAKE